MTCNHLSNIKEELAKNYACYVLVTCNEPNSEGEIQVDMTYEGDPALASYLIQGAQSVIDEQNLAPS